MALVGRRKAAGVPQHVRVSLEAQVSSLTSAAEATRYRALADANEQIADILEELRKIRGCREHRTLPI